MISTVRDELNSRFGRRVLFEEPLAAHTSFRIGGPAEILVFARARADLIDAIRIAERLSVPWLVLGRGSNVLVDDAGVRGVVIRNDTNALALNAASGLVQGDSGVRMPTLGAQTAKAGLVGLEFAVGIPGSVGGSVVMNAGAHGGSVSDTLLNVDVLVGGSIEVWTPTDLDHSYRTSSLQRRRDAIVLGAVFQLAHGEPATCLARIQEYRRHRHATQPGDPGAGSIFRNPPGDSAGALIDRAGLKGTRVGGAMISPKHANFIVNLGNATSADVLQLIDRARATVSNHVGVELHPEVELIGPTGRVAYQMAASPPST